MTEVFEYRQKPFPKVLAAAAFVAIAMADDAHALFRSAPYWGALVAVQALIHAWYAVRRITVDDRGLEVRGLGGARSVAWEQIEEGTLDANLPVRKSAIIARAANKPMGPTTDELVLKLVVTDEPALYVPLRDLKLGRAFADLVLSRIRFVPQEPPRSDPTSAPTEWTR